MKLSQQSLQYKVLKYIRENNLIESGDHIIVALSGGADSICLFDILFNLKDLLEISLSVCHYNHRLRGEDSYNDLDFVKKNCRDRGVQLILGEAASDNLFKNEEEARRARYAFFEKISEKGRGVKIAIAHNSNDSVETFLMRLIRGSGISGLKSIPSRRGNFIRPLLAIPRSEIDEYNKENKLAFVVDQSNKDIQFTRNFIRLKLLPLISEINPNIVDTLASTIAVIEDDESLLRELTEKIYKRVLISQESKSVILDRKKWLGTHPSLQMSVLRLAISKISPLTDIGTKHLQEVKALIYKGEGKKHKTLPHSLRVELKFGKIIVSKQV